MQHYTAQNIWILQKLDLLYRSVTNIKLCLLLYIAHIIPRVAGETQSHDNGLIYVLKV